MTELDRVEEAAGSLPEPEVFAGRFRRLLKAIVELVRTGKRPSQSA